MVRIFRERAGRSRKIVTLIQGLPGEGPILSGTARDVRRLCGSDGTVNDRIIKFKAITGSKRPIICEGGAMSPEFSAVESPRGVD